jgi:hypothetical protein
VADDAGGACVEDGAWVEEGAAGLDSAAEDVADGAGADEEGFGCVLPPALLGRVPFSM